MRAAYLIFLCLTTPALAQVDQQQAAAYFDEAEELCRREDGLMWGVSLCGPMVFADAASGTIATNRPEPDDGRPRSLGYANSAIRWGDDRWSTYVWSMIPDDSELRARLLIHELFHRVQPRLGLMTENGSNGHLDTLEGRFWLQLEWRALARALATEGPPSEAALSDVFAFRRQRRSQFAGSAAEERVDEIREGLAQYTGTIVAAADRPAAVRSALTQLNEAEGRETFVRTFAYTSGVAYGLLLDRFSSGWTRRVQATDDLGALLLAATKVTPANDALAAAARYDGAVLRRAEERRQQEHQVRVDELRALLVEGPVVIVPRGGQASFTNTGSTSIPGAGNTLANYRAQSTWGTLEAEIVLVADDDETFRVPAPRRLEGKELVGDGWSATLAEGWTTQPGTRQGDYVVVREDSKSTDGE